MGALSSGCVHVLDRDAPGHIDVEAEPKEYAKGLTEVPRDPGERVLYVSLGVTPYNIGASWGGPQRSFRAVNLMFMPSVEASFAWYDLEQSHAKPNSSFFRDYEVSYLGGSVWAPSSHHQINLGWAPFEFRGNEDPVFSGPLYVEWQRSFISPKQDNFFGSLFFGWLAVAGGWSVRPDLSAMGPQVTLSTLFGLFSLRATYHINQELFVGFVSTFKLPTLWIWSQ